MSVRPWLVVAGVVLAGCSSGSNGNGDGGSDAGNDAGPQGTVFGNVTTQLFPDMQYSTVTAQLYDAPPPSTIAVKAAQQQGGCTLLTPVTCTPACGADSYCSNAGACVPRPSPIGVGTLNVTGLEGPALALDPTGPMQNYASPTLYQPNGYPFPPCSEGSNLTVAAAKFTATNKCIIPLVVTSAAPIPALSGQAAHITWTPPGMTGISRIRLSLEISHHGGYRGQIDCDVPDTGSFDIPEPLVTALIALGRAGYPDITITRVSSASPSAEPGVNVQMISETKVPVDTGIISCGANVNDVCPTGKTCQNPGNLTCQ